MGQVSSQQYEGAQMHSPSLNSKFDLHLILGLDYPYAHQNNYAPSNHLIKELQGFGHSDGLYRYQKQAQGSVSRVKSIVTYYYKRWQRVGKDVKNNKGMDLKKNGVDNFGGRITTLGCPSVENYQLTNTRLISKGHNMITSWSNKVDQGQA